MAEKDEQMPQPNNQNVIQKCCCCIRADTGINLSVILNVVTIALGSVCLSRGDPASLYGASQEVVNEITKDMDKEGDEYAFWLTMQYVIWIGYIILCSINLLVITRWVFNDTYSSRMMIAVTNGLLSVFSLWNVIMGLLGFYFTPPEVFMFVIYIHVTAVAYIFAKEIYPVEDGVKPNQPTNPLPIQELLRRTDNWEKFMNRTWYCISLSDQSHDMVCFFEEYSWVNKADGTAGNDTVTQARGKPKVVYPTWKTFAYTNGVFKMIMKADGPCGTYFDLPGTIDCRYLMFPENDSQEQFWVQHGCYGPVQFVAIWCQDPFVSDEIYEDVCKKLKEEHNLDCKEGQFKQKKIDYTGYEIGSNGEKFRNPGYKKAPEEAV